MSTQRFVGGLDIPAFAHAGRRIHVARPMATLTLDETSVVFGGRYFGGVYLSITVDDVLAAERFAGRFGMDGVALELSDGRTAYFRASRDLDALLDALAARGVRTTT